MADQLRAEHGCRLTTARRATMVEAYAMAGRSPLEAAQALHLTEKTVLKYAKRFGVRFPG